MWRGSCSHLPKVKNPTAQLSNNLPLISAVVITYQPHASLLSNLRKLTGQVSEIIVVDNGSDGASAQLVEAAANLSGVRLIRNGSNLGIATALNIGIRHALKAGYQWIATFDQDSAIPERYFEQLFHALNVCPTSQKIGMIAPGRWSGQGTLVKQAHSTEASWSFVRGAVSSGSLISA